MAGYELPVLATSPASTEEIRAISSQPDSFKENGRYDIGRIFIKIAEKHGFRPLNAPGCTSFWSGGDDTFCDFTLPWGERAAYMEFVTEREGDLEVEAALGLGVGDEEPVHLFGLENRDGETVVTYVEDEQLSMMSRNDDCAGFMDVAVLGIAQKWPSYVVEVTVPERRYVERVVESLRETGFSKGTIWIRRGIWIPKYVNL